MGVVIFFFPTLGCFCFFLFFFLLCFVFFTCFLTAD